MTIQTIDIIQQSFDKRKKLNAEGRKLYAEANKLYAEGNKLFAEGNLLFINSVIKQHGNVEIKWSKDRQSAVVKGVEYK